MATTAEHRSDESPSSDETLGAHATDDHRGNKHPCDKDEEKGNDGSPTQPVGFFDKSLSKVRLQVFGLWARTSRSYVSMFYLHRIC